MNNKLANAAVEPFKQVAGVFVGLVHPLIGMRFVYRRHPELKKYWVWPILITIAAMAVSVALAVGYYDDLSAMIWSLMPDRVEDIDSWWASSLKSVLQFLVGLVLVTVSVVLVIALSAVFAAPFNDALSEAVEGIAAGKAPVPFSLSAVLRDAARAISIEAGKAIVYLAVIGPLFVLSFFVPLAAQILGVAGFLLSSWYLAFDYVDWPAARRDWPLKKRRQFFFRHLGTMTGFGVGVWVIVFLPIVNLLFMPAAVAGGTLLFVRLSPPE